MNREQYLTKVRRDMRHAYAEFTKFDIRWNEINDTFKEKIREENRIRKAAGGQPHSELSIVQQRESFLLLKDAMNAATWWRDKAQCLATILAAEKVADEMLREM